VGELKDMVATGTGGAGLPSTDGLLLNPEMIRQRTLQDAEPFPCPSEKCDFGLTRLILHQLDDTHDLCSSQPAEAGTARCSRSQGRRSAEPRVEVEGVVLIVATAVVAVVGYLKWREYLRYLDRAAERGNLTEAAKAASLYPDREHGLASLTNVLGIRRKGAG